MMITTIALLLLASPAVSLALFVAWILAERRNAPLKRRIGLGMAMLVTALPLAVVFAVAITQLDDQSYFAASVQTILDESINALESGETGFVDRLRTFREKQMLTYETRGDLLENARAFSDAGETLRGEPSQAAPESGHAPSQATDDVAQ